MIGFPSRKDFSKRKPRNIMVQGYSLRVDLFFFYYPLRIVPLVRNSPPFLLTLSWMIPMSNYRLIFYTESWSWQKY